MEVSSSSKYMSMQSPHCDVDQRDLEGLLEAFGSAFSLEQIATAYCQANRNVDTAGDILCTLNGSTSSIAMCSSEEKIECAGGLSREVSSETVLQKSFNVQKNTRASNSRRTSASIGTISGVLGKEYVRPKRLANESREPTKPLKIDSKELPISELWKEEVLPNTPEKNGTMGNDVAEFLYNMLGDGFKLEKSVIHEVLGLCGYDMQKSMEKLLYLSAKTLEKSDDIVSMAGEKSSNSSDEDYQNISPAESDGTTNSTESQKRDKKRVELQKEVLSLFQVARTAEEPPQKWRPTKQRARPFGRVVAEPLMDTTTEYKMPTFEPRRDILTYNDEDDENGYEVLRKAVKEYWVTMKDYYKASVDAFSKGDIVRANKLLEKGHFFKDKAREADERSTQKLLESREKEDEVPLDLRGHDKREALDLLKTHLTLLSGIPSIQYIRVLIGANDEDTTTEARKRLIVKLLKKEEISYIEEGDSQMIRIRVDVINPKMLSFEKNKR